MAFSMYWSVKSIIFVSFLAEEVNLNLNREVRKRAKVVESSESSSDSKTTPNLDDKMASELIGGEENGESSDSEGSQLESSNGVVENGKQNSSNESSADDDEFLSDSGDEDDSASAGEEVETEKDTPGHLKWKRNLLAKAKETYDMRNRRGTSLRKLVYSDLPLDHGKEDSEDTQNQEKDDESSNLGGLFQLAKKKEALSMNHRDDTSLPGRGPVTLSCDWSDSLIAPTIKSLFITGSWGELDAKALLEEDEEMYGDFEDLETGEKHRKSGKEVTKDGQGESVEDDELTKQKRIKKKKSLKAAFDVEYDDKDGGEGGYLEDLKREVSEQEQRNRVEFEGLDEQTRVQYEGFRPGSYVRMEIKGVCT